MLNSLKPGKPLWTWIMGLSALAGFVLNPVLSMLGVNPYGFVMLIGVFFSALSLFMLIMCVPDERPQPMEPAE